MISRLIFLCTIVATSSVCRVSAAQQSSAPPSAAIPDHPGSAFSPSGPWLRPLVIPEIVRYRELPLRMYLEPALRPQSMLTYFDDTLVPHFTRVLLEATDSEIQEVAALSLARVAREKLGDISGAVDTLRSVMQETNDRDVRDACAIALCEGNAVHAAKDLLRIAAGGSDAERFVIEQALCRWKTVEAGDLWRARLIVPFETVVSVRLACEGLTALNDQQSVTALTTILHDKSLEFARRTAAAKAICRLNPDAAVDSGTKLIEGTINDRLLAVSVLDHPKTESNLLTERLCKDASDAVAAAAWLQLFRQNHEILIGHLAMGRIHRDAAIRMTAARVMRLYPDETRAAWLHEMLSDRHNEVRNTARQMLILAASERPDLRIGIVERATAALRPESMDWQGIEQSLVILGQLQATQCSAKCVPLLDFPRAEVMVSAAWLIHLYPDPSIKDSVLQQAGQLEGTLLADKGPPDTPGQKLALLLQYCGLLRFSEIQPIAERQYRKGAPGGGDMRGAAMWTIGLLNERNPDQTVVASLLGRLNDRDPQFIEYAQVRRMAALALGMMRAKETIPELHNAFRIDPSETLIPSMVRWVFPLLDEPVPQERQPATLPSAGNWRLLPTTDGR